MISHAYKYPLEGGRGSRWSSPASLRPCPCSSPSAQLGPPPWSRSMPVVQAVPLTRLTYKQSNLSRATYRHFKMSHVRLKAKSEARQPLQVSSIRHFRDCGPFSGPQVDCLGGSWCGVPIFPEYAIQVINVATLVFWLLQNS